MNNHISFFVLTLFPELIDIFSNTSIIKKGQEKGLFDITIKNIRDYSLNRYNQVDDEPYGGGAGMLMRPEPIYNSYISLGLDENSRKKVVYFSPKGRKIDHEYIISLTNYENIVLICGHYEGIDQRIIDLIVDEEVSLGDFVLTGGEIPAMALIDSMSRQIEGVIKKGSLDDESFTRGILEHRQYTRPREFMGLKVPDVLVNGNHSLIEKFKLEDSVRETIKKRADLIEGINKDLKISDLIKKIIQEEYEHDKHERD